MSRWSILVALLLIPGGAAQLSFGEPLFEDPAGDVAIDYPNVQQQVGQHPNIDIRGVWVSEDPTHIHLQLQLEDLAGMTTTGGDTSILFTVDDWRYRAYMYRGFDQEEGFFGSMWREKVDSGVPEYVQALRVFGSVDDDVIWTSIPRGILATPDEPMNAGAQLRDVVAIGRTQEVWAAGEGFNIWDVAPDAGTGPDVSLTWRVQESNGLKLSTAQPFRSSNGEATTYQFDVVVRNPSEEAITTPLSVHDAPESWNVTLPGSTLQLQPKQVHTFPVVVSVPFAHEHGSADSMMLTAGNPETPVARLELGVHYLPIPQPAGHHNVLYLHSHLWATTAGIVNPPLGGSNGYTTFNTLQEDVSDAQAPIRAWSFTGPQSTYGWNSCLEPGLMMGLELDQEAEGRAQMSIQAEAPITAATLYGSFYVVPKGEVGTWCSTSSAADPIASFQQTLGEVAAMSTVSIDAPVSAFVSRIEHDPNNQLVLQLRMQTPSLVPLSNGAPLLLPGGAVEMPLLEYHDNVAPVEAFLKAVEEAGEAAVLSDVDPEVQKTPAGLFASLLGLLAVALLRRR